MDYTTFSQLVSSLGFPIVCCIILFYQNKQLSEAINNNTNIISKLESKIDTIVDMKEKDGQNDEN